jgi:hypothetical protein
MKKMNKKQTKARRRFLSIFGLGMMGFSFTSPKEEKKEETDQGETQFMLTADGQLVEVPKRLIKDAKRKPVHSNKSLWKWLQGHKRAR